MRFLIVDDSKVFVQKLTRLLTDIGHDVIACAGTGTEAVEVFGQTVPDIVTMDITMPDMDGVAATEQILERYPSAIIIMVTSQGHQPMVLRAVDAGAKGYLLKPLDRFKLVQAIDQVAKRYLM